MKSILNREFITEHEKIILLTVSILLIGGIMTIIGIPWCGYHLVDDHEFMAYTWLRLHDHATLSQLIKDFILTDLANGRWRPLYAICRMVFVWVLGTNITLYHVWSVIRAIIVFILVYAMTRAMRGSILQSYIVALVSLFGYQSAAWWKLGPQEMTATGLFAAGMCMMIIYLSRNSYPAMVSSMLLFICMGQYKESYILLMPFVILYAVYHDSTKPEGDVDNAHRRAIRISHTHLPYLGMLCGLLLAELALVFRLTRADYLSGSESRFSLRPLYESFLTDLRWFVTAGILLTLLLIIVYGRHILSLWREIILFAVYMAPQFYLYAPTGITERYILPASVGFALFYVLWGPGVYRSGLTSDREQNRVRLIVPISYIYAGILTVLVLIHSSFMISEGRYYKYRCDSMSAAWELIDEQMDLAASSAVDDPNILSCLYTESGWLIYLHELLGGHDTTYECSVDYSDYTYTIVPYRYEGLFASGQPEITCDSLDDIDIVVMYNPEDRHYGYDPATLPNFDLTGFTCHKCGTIDTYIRNQ